MFYVHAVKSAELFFYEPLADCEAFVSRFGAVTLRDHLTTTGYGAAPDQSRDRGRRPRYPPASEAAQQTYAACG